MAEILGRIKADLRLKKLILFIMGVLAAVSLIQGCKNAVLVSQDFQWDAAKALVMGIDPYDESLSPSGALPPEFEKYYLQMEANQFPSLLLLLYPYTLLPPLAARYAWLVSNLLFTAGIIALLKKTFLRKADDFTFCFFMLLMIAGTPYRNQLGVGQHTLFSFFFFLLAVYCIDTKEKGAHPVDGPDGVRAARDMTGGIGNRFSAAAMAALFVGWFKYTLTVPLALYFVYRKRYRELFFSAGLHAVLTAVCAGILGESFIDMIVKPLKVSSELAAEGGLDLGALLSGSPVSYVLGILILLGLFIFSLVEGLRHNDGAEGSGSAPSSALISMLTLWALIVTYHRTYDFFVIVVVLSLMLLPECPGYVRVMYAATLLGVFFVLRLFSESVPSRIAVGALYYAFTFAVTANVYKMFRMWRLSAHDLHSKSARRRKF